jgi:hypothetical protein
MPLSSRVGARSISLILVAAAASVVSAQSSSAQSISVEPLSTTLPHPAITWQASPEAQAYRIQIASGEGFDKPVDEDTVHIVERYIPAEKLAPGNYRYRVASLSQSGAAGRWSEPAMLQVKEVTNKVRIAQGSNVHEIQQLVQQAASESPAHVVFEPGTYRLRSDGTNTNALFELEGASDLIIDGQGANFIFETRIGVAAFKNCERVLLRNMNIDYDPVPYAAGRVLSVDEKTRTFVVKHWPRTRSLEQINSDSGPRDQHKFLLVNPRKRRLKANIPILMTTQGKFQSLGRQRYRLPLSNSGRSKLKYIERGDVYVNAPRGPAGFSLLDCDRITLKNVTAYYLPGIGFSTMYTNWLSLLDFELRLKPGRVLACQNGGMNIHNARMGPWLENCVFENTGDDNAHFNSLAIYPTEQPAGDIVSFKRNPPYDRPRSAALDLQKDDELLFFQPSEGVLGRRKVSAVRIEKKAVTVQLDEPIRGLSLGRGRGNGTQVFDVNRSCNEFVVRGSSFRRGRRIGLLVKGREGWISNCKFEELGSAGVEIFNAPHEGPFGREILIENCTFVDCGVSYIRNNQASALRVLTLGDVKGRPHQNLAFVNNRILNARFPPIELNGVDGMQITGNTFINRKYRRFLRGKPGGIHLSNCANILIEDNWFRDGRLTRQNVITQSDSEDVVIRDNQ